MTDLVPLVRGLASLRGTQAPCLLAVGWATVDLERTLDGIGIPGPGSIVAEPLLGARGARIDAGGTMVVVLEPSVEGRLAAALARRGEGLCAFYLAAEGAPDEGWRTTALGLPGRLLTHDLPWGPFLIAVARG